MTKKHDAGTDCEEPIMNSTARVGISQEVERKPRFVDKLQYDKDLMAHQYVGQISKINPEKLLVNLRTIGEF